MVTERYDLVARVLHWLTAIVMLGQIGLGFAADWVKRPLSDDLVDQHVRLGLLLLSLAMLRISWRLSSRPPPLPSTISQFHRRASNLVHRLLYACLVLMSVTGYVLWAWTAPNLDFWGAGPIPILFRGGEDEFWRSVAGYTHEYGAYLISALVLVHISAALYHQFVAQDLSISMRMGFGPLDAGSRAD